MNQQINLYLPIFRRQEKRFSAKTMLQAGSVIVVVVTLMGVYFSYRVGILEKGLNNAELQHAAAQRRLEQLIRSGGAKSANQKIDDEIRRMESEIAASAQIEAILREGVFTNTKGFSDYFIALSKGNLNGLWLTRIDISGAATAMTLEGMSRAPYLVPRYIRRLSRQKVLTNIEFREFQVAQPNQDQQQSDNVATSTLAFRVTTNPIGSENNDNR